MAKAARPKVSSSSGDPAEGRIGQEIIDRLRRYHSLGGDANDEAGDDQMPPKATVRKLAQRYGITESTLRKIRSFARIYRQSDLDNFCKLRRPNG